MTNPRDVDHGAPVLAAHHIVINARRDLVWKLHTDINAWPTWQTDVAEALLEQPLEVGASFRWTTYGVPIASTIYAIDVGTRILWGGTADGITGIHEWTFVDSPTGVTVTTTESFAGKPAEVHKDSLRALIDQSMTSWLQQLKAKSESL